jgi:protein phosphatase
MTLRKAMALPGALYEAHAQARGAHALTRAIGIREAVQVEPFTVRWARGDVVVLCTDGVSDELDASALGRALATVKDMESAACRVVDAVSAAGGWDNATVIVARRVA